MSLFYKFAYMIGMKPWEEMATLPISHQISTLLDREESERKPPLGSAIDLGCGTGIWTVNLAAHGWEVTGIDIVPKALRAARQRIDNAAVNATLVHGDLTAMSAADVGSGFRFALDLGAIHGLTDAQRRATAHALDAVAGADCTFLLLAWVPARRGPLPRGMSREDVQNTFTRWDIIGEDVADVIGAPRFVQKAAPTFYRLRRKSE